MSLPVDRTLRPFVAAVLEEISAGERTARWDRAIGALELLLVELRDRSMRSTRDVETARQERLAQAEREREGA